MPLGWIDFSKTERCKVLDVLSMLSEQGVLDELGIAPVRDGFANIFFPGTSTIQTRAKYFLVVPYIFKDFERGTEVNPYEMKKALDKAEKDCGEHFIAENASEEGVIGKRSLSGGSWVKRPPSEVYWAGLRQYGIFKKSNLSISEYIKVLCAEKQTKERINVGNIKDDSRKKESQAAKEYDDAGAGDIRRRSYWKVPTYRTDWRNDYHMKLTKEEGEFLKECICTAFPDSMLSYILRNNLRNILKVKDFQELEGAIKLFPDEIQRDYCLAADFSDFSYALRVIYNLIVSNGKNKKANKEMENIRPSFAKLSKVDMRAILSRVSVGKDSSLADFLFDCQKCMAKDDLEGLKDSICKREYSLKKYKSVKTAHPGEFDVNKWFAGTYLEYRFGNAKVIIKDIFESGVGEYA